MNVRSTTHRRLIARLILRFYILVHARLHLPGAGALMRLAAQYFSGLQRMPFVLPGVGTVDLDLRDSASFGMINFSLGEFGVNAFLFELMEKALARGDVLWDVGANLGWVCARFARAELGLSSIEAFEPSPAALKSLLSIFSEHPRVRVHSLALGRRNETQELNVLPGISEVASIRRELPGAGKIAIETRRGDDLVHDSQLPAPDVIKIDVEGFEPEVVAGLEETIQRQQPVIFFEYQFLSDEEIRQMIPANYEILLMLDDGRLTSDFTRRALGHDAVLFPRSKALFDDVPRV